MPITVHVLKVKLKWVRISQFDFSFILKLINPNASVIISIIICYFDKIKEKQTFCTCLWYTNIALNFQATDF